MHFNEKKLSRTAAVTLNKLNLLYDFSPLKVVLRTLQHL